MVENNELLDLVEMLLREQKGEYLSDLQRIILLTALDDSGKRKTYEAIADETGYSAKYIKQGIAPALWQLLSDLLGTKVGKTNIRAVLSQYQKQRCTEVDPQTTDSNSPDVTYLAKASKVRSDDPQTTDSNSPDVTPVMPFAFTVPTSNAKAIILLVDDQPQNLALLSNMLESEGYDVRQAINGQLALKVVKSHPPDLILLDVNMPGMNGYEVCRQLKVDPAIADIPVIFISALNESWDKVQAFSVGAVDYITKPLKVIEVMARITNQLNLAKSRRELNQAAAHLRYSQNLLIQTGLVDPAMGLSQRQYFDEYFTDLWQRAIAQRFEVGLILIEFTYLSGGGSADFPSEWQPLIALILSLLNPEQTYVACFAPCTVAIVIAPVENHDHIYLTQTIAQQLDSYKLPLSMDFRIVTHKEQPSDPQASERFLNICYSLLQQVILASV